LAEISNPRIGGASSSSNASKAQVIDDAGLRRSGGFADGVVVELARCGGQQQGAAAPPPISAGHSRQQRYGTQCLAALRESGHPLAETNERGLGGAIESGEAFDVGDRQPGDRGNAVGADARQHLALDPLEAERVPRDILAVAQPVAHQYVHEAERQCRVGADADRQMPIGETRRPAVPRIDDDELDAAPAHRV
jgi:hypothetical protein